jgi:hypothetical protein
VTFYSGLQATALDLLTRYGAARTFTRTTEGAYDPATGTASTTETTFSLRCAVMGYSDQEIDGSRILASDRKILAAVGDTEPAVGDTVSLDGAEARIQGVMPINPAGTVVYFELHARL